MVLIDKKQILSFIQKYYFVLLFIVVDLMLIILSSIMGGANSYFDIKLENNLPTYYQSSKTLLLAILVLVFYFSIRSRSVLFVSFILFCMSLEDFFQFHEQLSENYFLIAQIIPSIQSRFSWVIYYLPLIIIGVTALARFTFKYLKADKIFISGLVCLILAFLAEIIESLFFGASWMDISRNIEESLEMIGLSLMLSVILAKVLSLKFRFSTN